MNCPTPYKRAWDTSEQADGHRLLLLRDPKGARKAPDAARLHVYRCECGAFHVGHARQPIQQAS